MTSQVLLFDHIMIIINILCGFNFKVVGSQQSSIALFSEIFVNLFKIYIILVQDKTGILCKNTVRLLFSENFRKLTDCQYILVCPLTCVHSVQ